jgi:hemolysin D
MMGFARAQPILPIVSLLSPLAINEMRMQVDDKFVILHQGMAVTIEIKTSTRRNIEYLMSPALRYRQENLWER